MEKRMFENLSPEERLDHFQANSEGVETKVYLVPLTEEEVHQKRGEFAEKGIEIARIEDEKKEANKEFKAQLDPLKTVYKHLLEEIKTGQKEKTGKVFTMIDRDKKMVGFYNEEGYLIFSRPATHEEVTQLSIMSVK